MKAKPKVFEPIGSLVAIKVHKFDKTEGGLEIPDTVQDIGQCPYGVVVGAGPLCKQVKEGDVVLAAANMPAVKVKHGEDADELLVLLEDNLLGVSLIMGRRHRDTRV